MGQISQYLNGLIACVGNVPDGCLKGMEAKGISAEGKVQGSNDL